MSVRRCQEEISPQEFREWIAYYRLSPFGAEREDLRAGQVAAMLGNIHRRKGAAAFKASDFIMFQRSGGSRAQSPGAMKNAFRAWANLNNARIEKRAKAEA